MHQIYNGQKNILFTFCHNNCRHGFVGKCVNFQNSHEFFRVKFSEKIAFQISAKAECQRDLWQETFQNVFTRVINSYWDIIGIVHDLI